MIPIDRIPLAKFSEPIDMTSEGPFVLYELEENPEFLLVNYSEKSDYQNAWYRYGRFQDQNREIIDASKAPSVSSAGAAINVRPELYATFLNNMAEQGLYLSEEEIQIRDALLDAGLIVHTPTGDYLGGRDYRFLIASTEGFPAPLRPINIHHEYAHGQYVADESYRSFVHSLWDSLDPHEEKLLLKVLSTIYCQEPEIPSCRDVLVDETSAYALAGPQLLLDLGVMACLLTEEEAEKADTLFREFRNNAEQVLTLLRRK